VFGQSSLRFVLLVSALLGVYALAAWLFVLPEIVPPAIDLGQTADSLCDSAAAAPLGGDEILYVAAADLPQHLVTALLEQEDRSFWVHHGVNWGTFFRALQKNLTAGEYRYGAGTITMQLVRELWLGKRRNLLRKAREIAYALQLENRLSKKQILELYLNVVHWGPGVRGVGAASCYYFGIPASEISPNQAMRLVTVLTSPPRLGPELRHQAALERNTLGAGSCRAAEGVALAWPP
jgi:membrane peptidoglycan carboxypeptidase